MRSRSDNHEASKAMRFFSRSPELEPVSASPVQASGPSMACQWGGQYVADGSKWTNGLSRSGASPFYHHKLLLQNARNALHESSGARSLVTRKVDTVIDTGLVLQATPNADLLGITREQADAWAKDVQDRFELFMQSSGVSKNAQRNGYQLQRDISFFIERDNDVFLRIHYNYNDPSLLSPIQVQVIDPNQIGYGISYTSSVDNVLPLDDGIERDAYGKEIAYHVRTKSGISVKTVRVPKSSRDGLRTYMLHIFDPEYAGQTRGFAKLAHLFQELEGFTDFSISTIQKAINQASIIAGVESNSDLPAANPFPMAGINNLTGMTSLDSLPEGAATDALRATALPEFRMKSPGGMIITGLPGNQKLVPFRDTSPTENYSAFVDSFFSFLSASTGTPLEVLLMKFGQNYSASRGALILFWRIAQISRNFVTAAYQQPLYELWLAEEIAAGRVSAPGWQSPLLRAAWCSSVWRGSSVPDIDPKKSVEATELAVKMGLTNVQDAAYEYNGSDWVRNNAVNKEAFADMPGPAPWGRSSKETDLSPGTFSLKEGDEDA